MAKFNYKKNRIDRLNDAVIKRGLQVTTKSYKLFFERIIGKASNLAKKPDFKSREVKDAINSVKVDQRGYIRQTYNMVALSGITNVIEAQQLSQKADATLIGLAVVLAIYPLSKPKTLALKIDKLSIAYSTNSTSKLNGVEKQAFKGMKKYFDVNRGFIREQLKATKIRNNQIVRQVKSKISKTIFKDLKKQIRTRVEVTVHTKDGVKVIKRPKTFQEIRKDMRSKFGKQVDYRVRRIVDTELHDLAENTKQNQHLLMGYTNKRWNTQGDSDVRDVKGTSHKAMNGVVIPIKNKFRVKGGGTGMYPGDPNLPPRQRINCRCFLTYTR
jgi:hypothetical protein